MNLITHLIRQRVWSLKTFGPGPRLLGVLDHIGKEIEEVYANPTDLEEWIDIALLAFDGAWRSGHGPREIAEALEAKLAKNEQREWPDWREVDDDRAVEHTKEPSIFRSDAEKIIAEPRFAKIVRREKL